MTDAAASQLHTPFVGLTQVSPLVFVLRSPELDAVLGVVPPVLSQKKKYIYGS